jgi:hypothetical protein
LIKVISDLWRGVYDLESMFNIDSFNPTIGLGHFNSRPSNLETQLNLVGKLGLAVSHQVSNRHSNKDCHARKNYQEQAKEDAAFACLQVFVLTPRDTPSDSVRTRTSAVVRYWPLTLTGHLNILLMYPSTRGETAITPGQWSDNARSRRAV